MNNFSVTISVRIQFTMSNSFAGDFECVINFFCHIVIEVAAQDEYFHQCRDALGVFGPSLFQKTAAAMRMLTYGQSADSTDECVQIGESTALVCLRLFVKTIFDVFNAEYLRALNNKDIAQLLSLGEQCGFPRMLGSLDYMH